MGNFRIIINAVGNHGDKRNLKDGDKNYGCMSMTCSDCLAREFVELLKRRGHTVESATLEHWPEINAGSACTYMSPLLRYDENLKTTVPVELGHHTEKCGTGQHPGGGPIVDDLLTGIRHGTFEPKASPPGPPAPPRAEHDRPVG